MKSRMCAKTACMCNIIYMYTNQNVLWQYAWPQVYKTRVHSQTQNKAQSLRFILSLKLYSSFITSRPALFMDMTNFSFKGVPD